MVWPLNELFSQCWSSLWKMHLRNRCIKMTEKKDCSSIFETPNNSISYDNQQDEDAVSHLIQKISRLVAVIESLEATVHSANKAKRLILMIRRSFQDLSNLVFLPFIRGLSASAPRIWYASLFAKPRCRYQPSRANSKISYKVGNWHASPPLWRETSATGPSFLAVATTSGWPDYRLQDIQGPFGYWSELVFASFRSTRPKRAPLQGTPRCEPPPKERIGVFGEGCEILE